MNVRVYRSFDDIPRELRPRLCYPAQSNFLLSLDWFSLLFETSLRATLAPRIYVAHETTGEPLGALFCGADAASGSRRLTSMTNFYTLEYSSSVVRPDAALSPIGEILRHIAVERPRWHSIRLHLMREDAPETRHATEQLERAGYGVRPFFQYENWYTAARGMTFRDYFEARPSQVRNTITRKQKKLEQTTRVEIRIVRSESPELERVLRDWIRIYESSWKRPEPFPEFIPALVATCARLGILRLGVLYVDDVPSAGQLWITAGSKTIIYKLAYDEQYRDRGVGSILSKEMFRVAIDEDKVHEIDYGVGSESYKSDWMSDVRRLVGLEAHNRWTLPGLAALGLDALQRAARRIRASSPTDRG